MKRWFFILLIAACLGLINPVQASGARSSSGDGSLIQAIDPDQNLVADLSTNIKAQMQAAKVPGLSIALIQDGKIAWVEGFGEANSITGKPVTGDTVFEVASISKAITAYAALGLVERGVLSLDKPVHQYLSHPWLPASAYAEQITLRQLLSHTSGLTNAVNPVNKSILYPPGERFEYSGVGFIYLQAVMEQATGKSLEQIAQELVFKPLEMDSSSYVNPPKILPRLASGHLHYGLILQLLVMVLLVVFILVLLVLFIIQRIRLGKFGLSGKMLGISYLIAASITLVAVIYFIGNGVNKWVTLTAFWLILFGGCMALLLFAGRKLIARLPGRWQRPRSRNTLLVMWSFISALALLFVTFALSGPVPRSPAGPPNAAFSLRTTAPDLAKFLLELSSPQHIDPALMAEMTSPQVQIENDQSWGLGMAILHSSQGDLLWHDGNNPDVHAWMGIDQGQMNGVVVLTNGENGAPLANEIAHFALNKLKEAEAEAWNQFEAELESMRQEMKIPGMSAAVVKDGHLAWAHGFGFADIENSIPAAPETPYHLASVTKPFAALVIMQLVQEGRLSLNDPVSRYGVDLPEGDKVLVRHLLSHTSAGTPGASYWYDGNRYARLSQVIQAATGRSFQEWLFERILQPLGLEETAPSPSGCIGLPFAPTCERIYKAIAKPYQLDENLSFVPGYYQTNFNTGAGLISTVTDLAKLDAALDANTLVTAATKELMFTPTVSNSGKNLPYGLGWFTQQYRGNLLIWHYGQWPPSISSLFLKFPDEGLTFIVLANTDGLSSPFDLGDGDITTSLMALAFYKHFILGPRYGQPLPAIDWSGDASTELELIKQVQDEAVRELLTQEWFSRQMVARSLAQVQTQAGLLADKYVKARELAESMDSKILDAYAGEYLVEQHGVTLRVLRVEKGLLIQQGDETPGELLPLSETRFFIVVGNDIHEVEFTYDKTNQVTGMVLTVYGQSFTAMRK